MPLGLAKDSMLNLAELASKVDDDEEPNDISATKGNKFGRESGMEWNGFNNHFMVGKYNSYFSFHFPLYTMKNT